MHSDRCSSSSNRSFLLIAICFLIAAQPALAEVDAGSGNYWLPLCTQKDSLCDGFVAALCGSFGDPRLASKEKGNVLIEAILADLIDTLSGVE